MKRPSIRNIVVPIDFSPASIEAVTTAKKVAQRFGAVVHLVHVHHEVYPVTFMGPIIAAGEPASSFTEHRERDLRQELERVAQENDLPAPRPIHLCDGSSVYHEICRLAQRLSADLIVLSTHGRTGLKHTFVGSTAERVVQHSPCPVLVARQRAKKALAAKGHQNSDGHVPTILVPVDFSDASPGALEYAIEFATGVSARLILLHVMHLDGALSKDGYAVYRNPDIRQSARREAARHMEAFVQAADFGEVKFETLLKIGHPISEICAVAEECEADLIITATHGRTGFRHLLIGSVAELVVRHATSPVLVVPSHPEVRVKGLERFARQNDQNSDKRSVATTLTRDSKESVEEGALP